MITKTKPRDLDHQVDEEARFINRLLQRVKINGIEADHTTIINVYISLKSTPFLILTGGEQTGKIELIKSLAQELTEEPNRQCQIFVAHPRWAAHSQDAARFVDMQASFNRSKLLSLIEDAMQPENADKLFIACLTRISPAEIYDYFLESGFQFWPNQGQNETILDAGSIPYPPNFRLIGTRDAPSFDWWKGELMNHTSVVHWSGKQEGKREWIAKETAVPPSSHHILRSDVSSEQAAYAKLQELLQSRSNAFLPLIEVMVLLESANVTLNHEVINRIVVYLANSWSKSGNGLFTPLFQANFNLAFDLALMQYVLPWILTSFNDPHQILHDLGRLSADQFPKTSAFISGLSAD